MNRAQMFHNFITSLKLGDKVLIRDGGITAAFDELCGDTASFDEKTDDNGRTVHVHEVYDQEGMTRSMYWVLEAIAGALLFRGLTVDGPRFFTEDDREMPSDFDYNDCDCDPDHCPVDQIAFTVVEWKSPNQRIN
ncbi:MAG: hypothetical protein UT02_C0064G0002 [Parcubacteria group bacterium GW2011_GWC2_38_7]|nr:MAG: hypothetical protein UT02_C0064G0002 [Parcubacteria group bacterium GW2011_GWC2_38_7]